MKSHCQWETSENRGSTILVSSQSTHQKMSLMSKFAMEMQASGSAYANLWMIHDNACPIWSNTPPVLWVGFCCSLIQVSYWILASIWGRGQVSLKACKIYVGSSQLVGFSSLVVVCHRCQHKTLGMFVSDGLSWMSCVIVNWSIASGLYAEACGHSKMLSSLC